MDALLHDVRALYRALDSGGLANVRDPAPRNPLQRSGQIVLVTAARSMHAAQLLAAAHTVRGWREGGAARNASVLAFGAVGFTSAEARALEAQGVGMLLLPSTVPPVVMAQAASARALVFTQSVYDDVSTMLLAAHHTQARKVRTRGVIRE
ncbi:MAG: hypothetical protein EOO41_05390 [Methanobacteriota archaeon]|nr:MAG: hypothetical protein EOO41_05390 [Euryarchaeota archaeon]